MGTQAGSDLAKGSILKCHPSPAPPNAGGGEKGRQRAPWDLTSLQSALQASGPPHVAPFPHLWGPSCVAPRHVRCLTDLEW